MANNTIDVISQKIQESLKRGVIQIGDAVVDASVGYVKNGINEALNGRSSNLKNNSSEASRKTIDVNSEDEDDIEDLDDGAYDNGEDNPIPIAFNVLDKKGNLHCAVATFKLWGERDTSDYPHIVASNPTTGIAFVGTIEELQHFCQHNDLDDKWEMYGVDSDGNYDSAEIDDFAVPKNIVKYIASQLIAMDYDHEQMAKQFRKNHVAGKEASVTRMLVNIPFLSGVPMAHFAVPYAIIYGAEKNGKFQTYVHEFGENSNTMPTIYTVGDGSKDPVSIVIHGGKMVVKDGFICH